MRIRELLREMAVISTEVAGKTFYHGTGSKTSAENILKNGIQPREISMPDKANSRAQLAPAKGRIYFTSDIGYAGVYALGGAMFGHESSWFSSGGVVAEPFGFIFEISGDDIVNDVVPDEDSIGEFVTECFYLPRLIREHTRLSNMEPTPKVLEYLSNNKEQYEKHLKLPINLPENRWAKSLLLSLAEKVITPKQKMNITDGDAGSQAAVGKKIQKIMGADLIKWMINNGAHVAYLGNIYPVKAYAFKKVDASTISAKT